MRREPMSAVTHKLTQSIGALEPTRISCRDTAAFALNVVRDGVITGEGPTTTGRVHFSRELDADDAAWCARILTATAVEHEPVSRADAEALFEINDAADHCAVSGNGDRKLGPNPRGRRRYRGAGMDRGPDARQAPRQPDPDAAGRHHHRRGDPAAGPAAAAGVR